MPKLSPSPAAARCGRPLSMDDDTRDVTAWRNVLLGLWVARRLGLPPSEREAYAWSVHFADFATPGDEDVVAKVLWDLRERDIGLSERQIRNHLREMELRAFLQLSATKPGSSVGGSGRYAAREDRRRRKRVLTNAPQRDTHTVRLRASGKDLVRREQRRPNHA